MLKYNHCYAPQYTAMHYINFESMYTGPYPSNTFPSSIMRCDNTIRTGFNSADYHRIIREQKVQIDWSALLRVSILFYLDTTFGSGRKA